MPLTLILLNNLISHTHFWLSANQITSYVFIQIHKLNANSVDPDQMAFWEAIWSGSTLFAKVGVVMNSRIRVNRVDWSLKLQLKCILHYNSTLMLLKFKNWTYWKLNIGKAFSSLSPMTPLYYCQITVFYSTGSRNILTFRTLWANQAENKMMTCFLFFPENRFWHFMQIIS